MSQYGAVVTTVQGRIMLTEAFKNKKPLIFTKMALGDGVLLDNDIETMTTLKRQTAVADISSYKNAGDGMIDIAAAFDNSNITSGFYARELGVFAKVGENGTEALFAYTNAGDAASYTPAGGSLDEKLITITFVVGSNVNTQINLNSNVYITQGVLTKHNEAPDAHDNRFKALEQSITSTANTKLDKTSSKYVKSLATEPQGVKVTKGDDSVEHLNLLTALDNAESQGLAPTLGLVKTLLSALNIKNPQDVVTALGEQTLQSLGVKYDFSNPNAWYICLGQLFGGLIIQGGLQRAGTQKRSNISDIEGSTNLVMYPITFKQTTLMITFGIHASDSSIFWGNSSASCIIRRHGNTYMRYEVHSDYESMLRDDSNIRWLAIGI